MDIPKNVQEQLNQFQQLQQQAQMIATQKNTNDIQIKETESALEELKKADKDADVFKTAGNLLIKVDHDEINSELEDKLETYNLRQQTMSRQEDRVMKKLKEMQANIEKAMKGLQYNSEPSDVE
ncbi:MULTISPECIES: prefoldin subunit beta [unclassified Methanobrevibacter]|jgi:prefoldin beta subunit|uniref:prefoldin subunit beta n=1 Tax=unclassified Methanobrevibacter TaxID=2638681 RepID=UPI002A0C005B|nr:prefoldin subunit beta [Methanobacteriaceae archaeon]